MDEDESLLLDAQDRSFGKVYLSTALWSLFYIILWFSTSLSLSLYNKYLFSASHYNFQYPLFTTCLHTCIQFILSAIVACLYPKLKPSKKHTPSIRDYLFRVLPCGFATGADIGLSNNSLRYISLTFYTMVKSGAPVFVLLFAFLFRLEKPTVKLIAIISVIVFGVYLMVKSR
jgi:solute carrier family 35 protein C2